jgi:membrane protein involved in colicin uptake
MAAEKARLEQEEAVAQAAAQKARDDAAAQAAAQKAREDAAARAAAQKAREDAAARARQALEQKRKDHETNHALGLGLMILGGAAFLGAAVFAGLGGGVNSSIQSGSFTTGQDIQNAANQGQTYNVAAYVLTGAGVVAAGIGVPVFVLTLDHDKSGSGSIAPHATTAFLGTSVSLSPGGLLARGTF